MYFLMYWRRDTRSLTIANASFNTSNRYVSSIFVKIVYNIQVIFIYDGFDIYYSIFCIHVIALINFPNLSWLVKSLLFQDDLLV